MNLGSGKIKAIQQKGKYSFSMQFEECLSGICFGDDQRGFTLLELIMMLVIVGILAVFAVPRFFDADVFKSRGFADQVQSALRYAQKEAVAQRRFVCVTLTSTSIALTVGTTNTCGTPLALPTGGLNIINVPINSGITMTYSSSSFYFDALGSTPNPQTITVSGATNSIVVEAETGYVHSP